MEGDEYDSRGGTAAGREGGWRGGARWREWGLDVAPFLSRLSFIFLVAPKLGFWNDILLQLG